MRTLDSDDIVRTSSQMPQGFSSATAATADAADADVRDLSGAVL